MNLRVCTAHTSDRILTTSSRQLTCAPRPCSHVLLLSSPQVHIRDHCRNVIAEATRGRPRKTAQPEDTPPLEPSPETDAVLASEEKPKKTRARRTKSATAVPVEAPADDSLLELQPELEMAGDGSSYSQDTAKAASAAAAVFDQPGPASAELDIELASGRKTGRPRKQQPAAAKEPEASDGSYGVETGLAHDSREKTVLRAILGHDLYQPRQNLSEQPPPEDMPLPRKYRLSKNAGVRETANHKFHLAREYWDHRAEHQAFVHDVAWQAHHRSRERAVNIYSNTRRVAGLMTSFENDDFMLQNRAPSSIAPWARAEIVFATEIDEFNEMLTEQLTTTNKRLPQEAQDEELDLLDEALFLLRPDDDHAAASRSKQQSTEQELLDNYLEGMLPGATLDNLAAAYADDIFDAEREEYGLDDDTVVKAADDTEKA